MLLVNATRPPLSVVRPLLAVFCDVYTGAYPHCRSWAVRGKVRTGVEQLEGLRLPHLRRWHGANPPIIAQVPLVAGPADRDTRHS
jgi:hypothetical protein